MSILGIKKPIPPKEYEEIVLTVDGVNFYTNTEEIYLMKIWEYEANLKLMDSIISIMKSHIIEI